MQFATLIFAAIAVGFASAQDSSDTSDSSGSLQGCPYQTSMLTAQGCVKNAMLDCGVVDWVCKCKQEQAIFDCWKNNCPNYTLLSSQGNTVSAMCVAAKSQETTTSSSATATTTSSSYRGSGNKGSTTTATSSGTSTATSSSSKHTNGASTQSISFVLVSAPMAIAALFATL